MIHATCHTADNVRCIEFDATPWFSEATSDSGIIGLNGAAARLAMPGDKLIIVSYASFDAVEARGFQPRVALVNEKNQKIWRP
jgi:aspartate 1-decarboxylase